MALATSNETLLSKIATNDGHGEKSAYFDGWKAYDSDPYHPINNRNGVIQMGLAENQLSFDLVEGWIKENPDASVCTLEGVSQFRDVALFQDYHGLSAFRNAVANFMGKVRGGKVKFDPDRVVMSGGATGAHETMAFCLADPGDAFLVPTPYYAGGLANPCSPVHPYKRRGPQAVLQLMRFDRDLRWRTGVQLIPVVCESSNGFKVTRDALEIAYKSAQEANIKVKGVLITNPSNPLGTILDRETLKSIVSFINEQNIHLICDEIYAATVFSQPDFISISEILEEGIKCNLNLIHVVYSLSKDLGFPGFRVGVIYSYNDDVVNCARKMSSYGLVSSQTQHLLSAMLSDDQFVDKLISESAERLASRHKMFTVELEKMGIGCLKSNAGLFCWMDLRALLEEKTEDGERALWHTIINNVKLNVSPGSSFHCSEPGWFRVCFANMDDETMKVALKRIQDFVFKPKNKEIMTPKKVQQKWQANKHLRLSLCGRRYEEVTKTPVTMSPHSPLVRAT